MTNQDQVLEENEMMLEKDLGLRAFVDEALKAITLENIDLKVEPKKDKDAA